MVRDAKERHEDGDRRTRGRWVVPLAALLVTGLATAAGAAIVAPAGPRGPGGYSGYLGPLGYQGPGGPGGTLGATGETGRHGGMARHASRVQVLNINWQHNPAGHDKTFFVAPGIGHGEVVCNTRKQWLRFFPDDLSKRANMWITRTRGNIVAVKANHLDYPNTGKDFQEGMNEVYGDQEDTGSFTGIISQRPGKGGRGGPGPSPTTIQMSWHWVFDDQYGPRCYVMGRVTT